MFNLTQRAMPLKITLKYHFLTYLIDKTSVCDNILLYFIGKAMGYQTTSYIVGGNANWYNTFGQKFGNI